MRRAGDIGLSVLQWLLVLWGVALIVISLIEYGRHSSERRGLSVSGFESSLEPRLIHEILLQGAIGLVAVGLGGAVLYLRRMYHSRHQ